MFAQLGCGVIEGDAIARELLPRPDVKAQLVQWWGPAVLKPDGSPDRVAIGRIVFNDADQRVRLEKLLHPPIIAQCRQRLAVMRQDPERPAVVIDMPLLLEVGLDRDCDVLVWVDAPREQRLARVRQTRGWTADELDRREKAQWSLDRKADMADYCVDNGVDESRCFDQVRQVLTQIITRQPRTPRNFR